VKDESSSIATILHLTIDQHREFGAIGGEEGGTRSGELRVWGCRESVWIPRHRRTPRRAAERPFDGR
jgi:hypothetical protein